MQNNNNEPIEIELKSEILEEFISKNAKILIFNQDIQDNTPDNYSACILIFILVTIEQSLLSVLTNPLNIDINIDSFFNHNGTINLEIIPDDDFLKYSHPYRYITFNSFSIKNLPEDIYKKYKIVKPKDEKKDNGKTFTTGKAKVDKDNEKSKYCAVFYLPEPNVYIYLFLAKRSIY